MDWSCDEMQSHVILTLKDINSRRWKTAELPVSKDCLQGGTKTQEQKEKCPVQPNYISFNIAAHSGLMEETFSGHRLVYLLHFFPFSTH